VQIQLMTDIVNVVDAETWIFQKLKYSHIYRFRYSSVLCH